jgi:hypothetical protein
MSLHLTLHAAILDNAAKRKCFVSKKTKEELEKEFAYFEKETITVDTSSLPHDDRAFCNLDGVNLIVDEHMGDGFRFE